MVLILKVRSQQKLILLRENYLLLKEVKEKSKKGAVTAKPFDAVKVCDSLCSKYTKKEILALIAELQLMLI
jgi:hypothetical protein